MSFFEIIKTLFGGVGYSLEIFFLTLLISLPLGMIICVCRMSKIKPIAWFFRLYISVMRGTPLMLQLFVVYFCPYYIFKIMLKDLGDNWLMIAVIIGFALNYAAYFAEIYRSGIASMSEGQYEAAKVLGMNKNQTFFIVILPQVIRRILPSMTNEVITLVKDTSLAFAIGQIEMFTVAKRLAASEVSMLPYVAAAVLYYIFNLIVAFAMERLEKHFSKYAIK
ncbi:MAG: amino acid ABC transporter permease [Eubacteriales bacterium]